MHSAFLLLGTNLGDKPANLRKAREVISKRIGNVLKSSSVYETAPWGMESMESFLNQVIEVETGLGPLELMKALLEAERGLGRERVSGKVTERIIDLDILFYDDLILEGPDLVIPHPRLHLRRFTMVPLAEIAPLLKHPVLGKKAGTLLAECEDKLAVNLLKNSSLG